MEYWEDPELLREAVLDLSSDRRVDLRMRDASLIALQGAAAGATVAVVLAISLLRFS
jgi:sensitive to high expression protein 9